MTNVKYINGNRTVGNFTAQCIIRTVLAAVIAFIIFISATTIATGFLTKEIGYDVQSSETGEKLYSYRFTGNEPENWKDPNLDKYDFEKEHVFVPVRSILSDGQRNTVLMVAQVVSAVIWIAMIYSVAWAVGDADANKVELGKAHPDRKKPIKVALYSSVPYAALYILLLFTKLFDFWHSTAVTIYQFLTFQCFYVNELLLQQIAGDKSLIAWPNFIGLFFTLLILPAIILIGYKIGQKHIVIRDKILYKK